MRPIIAKVVPATSEPLSLIDHTRDVVNASRALFGSGDAPSRLGRQWLRFFRITAETHAHAFFSCLNAACWLHDIGKANSDMQSVLYRDAGHRDQLIRHEYLSVIIMSLPQVQEWLNQRVDVNWPVVLSAIGSHHLKFCKEDLERTIPGETIEVFLTHPDFQELLQLISKALKLTGVPELSQKAYWGYVSDGTAFNPQQTCQLLSRNVFRQLDRATSDETNPIGRLLRSVRAALIVADGAASGLRRQNQSIEAWISSCFEDTPESLLGKTSIEQVILRRISDLAKGGIWKSAVSMESSGWNSFQADCDSLPSRACLLAPCGSGKTLAAWRWIATRTELPVKRVLFLYPTRATATEGFKDYVSWAPESSLLHGNASYDLDGMFPAEDPRTNRIASCSDPRLFALQHWNKQVFSATIDQFFSFMSYNYAAICLLPLLADSVVVIDEVHSFDPKMFSALLAFLRNFDVPALCMTATLQAGRAKQLNEVVQQTYNEKPDALALIASTPRYRIKRIEASEAEVVAIEHINRGHRVLWVVNQVSRAQEIARALLMQGEKCSFEVVCYHSRFRLEDRRDRHQDTVKKIRPGQQRIIAITTQVCEMSLDIDADVLITEACPISSVIQRMGRCRRGRIELTTFGPGDVYVYKSPNERVYNEADLVGFDSFVDWLVKMSPVSQMHLEEGMQIFGSKEIEAERRSSFMTSGPYAMSGEDSFRDIEEFSQQCILDNEIDDFLKASPEKRAGFICPVPKKLKPVANSKLPNFLRVGNAANYKPETGYHEQVTNFEP
jgi:CRISPR-associated endonuclease/helicase Cas3